MEPTQSGPVNIASLPLRSPFRYPGGKSWLVPYIRQWLAAQPTTPRLLVEPFAGGGTVTLTAVAEDLVKKALMVELDAHVAAVWQTILNGHGNWLANQVSGFKFCPETVRDELAKNPRTQRTQAFQTLLHNRVSRGGIIAPGAGLLKNGEDGKGMGSRWYPETLKRRIEKIVELKDRIAFINDDGISALHRCKRRTTAVFFIDPPYVGANKNRLYTHGLINHVELFRVAAKLSGDFLMTYDMTDLACELATKHGFDTETVEMKTAHHSRMRELLIGRDLSWARKSTASSTA